MKYLIVYMGKESSGKSTVLRYLVKLLVENGKNFKCFIDNCNNRKEKEKVNCKDFDWLQYDKGAKDRNDIYISGEMNKKKIVLFSSGDSKKCIEESIKTFKNVDIGIIACRCIYENNGRYEIIKKIRSEKKIKVLHFNSSYHRDDNVSSEEKMLLDMNESIAHGIFEFVKRLVIKYV